MNDIEKLQGVCDKVMATKEFQPDYPSPGVTHCNEGVQSVCAAFAEITRFVEVIFLLAFVVFTMYDRTIKVPAMEERLASQEVRIFVVESRLNSIQDTLDRIENAVRKKR